MIERRPGRAAAAGSDLKPTIRKIAPGRFEVIGDLDAKAFAKTLSKRKTSNGAETNDQVRQRLKKRLAAAQARLGR
jgi:hypothetical protein